MTASGRVYHERRTPATHAFAYDHHCVVLDVSEIPPRLPQFVRFSRCDFMPSARSLRDEVCHRVRQATGEAWRGDVIMMANLRGFGILMNPITVFLCVDEAGDVHHLVLEVHNTPWGERHVYVAEPAGDRQVNKVFHVSPFMPMDTKYHFDFNANEDGFRLRITVSRADEVVFTAGMAMAFGVPVERAGWLTSLALALMPARTLSLIYFEALRLFAKRVPFYPHPDRTTRPRHETTDTP